MNLQRTIVRLLMKLPDSRIYKLSGAEPIAIDGHTLEARTQYLSVQGKKGPPLHTLPVQEGRKATADGLALIDGDPEKGVSVREMTLPGPAGPLDARLYRPQGASGPKPALVWFHFGGCVIGDLETSHVFCTMLAKHADCAVLSVDYRLAPKHKFPAAFDDALAAYRYAVANAEGLGFETGRIGIGGDSAGGYLSAAVCQALKREGGAQPALQLLIYPVTDMEAEGGSMESCKDCYPLSADIMRWFIGHYLNGPDDAKDVRASPAKADDLSGLAPAIVMTAGFDPLRDQGAAYAGALQDAGVPVTYRLYGELAHAFTAMTGAVPAARKACLEIAADVRRGLHG